MTTDEARQLEALRSEVNLRRTVMDAQAKAITAFNAALGINPNSLVGPGEDALSRVRALVTLLRESRREHSSPSRCSRYRCGPCNCGADDWNAKVDAALKGIA